MLQCATIFRNMRQYVCLQFAAIWCNMLHLLQCAATANMVQSAALCSICCNVLQYRAICCNMVQYAARCSNMVQYAAICSKRLFENAFKKMCSGTLHSAITSLCSLWLRASEPLGIRNCRSKMVFRRCRSKMLPLVTRSSASLHSILLCCMHRHAQVRTGIYIYIYI